MADSPVTTPESVARAASEGAKVLALLGIVVALVGAAAAVLAANIGHIRQRLRGMPGVMMGRMMEHMPDE